MKEKRTFQVINVKCEGCATTLKNKLAKEFGEIEIDLTKMPREITLHIEKERISSLKNALKALGYPMADEKLGFLESGSAQAKSFISCATGKLQNAKNTL